MTEKEKLSLKLFHQFISLSRLTGGSFRNLLGAHPNHPRAQITEALQCDNTHCLHPNTEPVSGLFKLMSQSFPVRLPLGEFP